MIIIRIGIALLLPAGAVALGLCLGEPALTPSAVLRAMGDAGDPRHVLVTEVRAPRVVLAVLAGGGLALSGLLLQDVLRNPIAGPELLGVSSGAAVVTATIVVLRLDVAVAALPTAALLGALVAGAVVLAALRTTRSPDHVALVGAAISAACGGLVVAVVGLGTQGDVVALFRYLLGSLAARGWVHVEAVAPWLAAGAVAALLLRRRVEAMTLGDDVAAGLGVAVGRTRLAAVATAALLAAAVASVCGPVAFVALLAPHLARRLVGSTRTTRSLGHTVWVGAVLLVLADLASRTLLYPVEVPVGVATTLVGVPLLVLVLRARRGAGRPPGVPA
ncbi:iron chelate uptake ABC transporter family permease subunit [Nocardioides lentus]|uniref:Iron chelate uptake ABC transporter family permease subunit n=1 Tax=Nocardioides lentus TaxID=338077 RepID=A0ABN2NW59_9ACTN